MRGGVCASREARDTCMACRVGSARYRSLAKARGRLFSGAGSGLRSPRTTRGRPSGESPPHSPAGGRSGCRPTPRIGASCMPRPWRPHSGLLVNARGGGRCERARSNDDARRRAGSAEQHKRGHPSTLSRTRCNIMRESSHTSCATACHPRRRSGETQCARAIIRTSVFWARLDDERADGKQRHAQAAGECGVRVRVQAPCQPPPPPRELHCRRRIHFALHNRKKRCACAVLVQRKRRRAFAGTQRASSDIIIEARTYKAAQETELLCARGDEKTNNPTIDRWNQPYSKPPNLKLNGLLFSITRRAPQLLAPQKSVYYRYSRISGLQAKLLQARGGCPLAEVLVLLSLRLRLANSPLIPRDEFKK